MMKRKTAAEYADMSEAAFLREIAAGRLPDSVMFGGREHWHKAALDRALSAIAGENTADYESEFWNRGQAA
jgi:hypothetical protein